MQVRAIRSVHPCEVMLTTGTVQGVLGELVTVELAGGAMCEATRAVSCLVEPTEGDRVLMCGSAGQQGYHVLAVLERLAAGPLSLVAAAGLRVRVSDGAFCVNAPQVEIHAGDEARLTAATLQLGANELRLVFRELAAWGEAIVTRSRTVRAVAESADFLLDRVRSRLARSYRSVTELDHTDAKQVYCRVSETLSMHSGNTVLTSEELVKVDGKLVQIG